MEEYPRNKEEDTQDYPQRTFITPVETFPPKGWSVARAVLHQAVPMPQGDTTTSLYSSTGGSGVGKGRGGVKMTYTNDGLFCEYKGHSFVIPLANVVVCYL